MTTTTTDIVSYRDDGPLAETVGAATRGRLSPLAFAALGALAPFVALSGRIGLAVLGAGWCALVAALGSHSAHDGRVDWLVPPVLRAAEYVFVAAVGLAAGVPGPLIFGLICAVAYHHYDVVYRLRQRVDHPRWVSRAGLGWEGRMIVVALAAFVGVATPVYLVLTVALGALFVAESVLTWVRAQHREAPEETKGEKPAA